MPRSTKPTTTTTTTRVVHKTDKFNLANALGIAIVGLLVSLLGSGIISMFVLYVNVAKLEDAESRTETQLSRHVDHSVDRESYDKRDAAIQKQLNDKASKDEVEQLRNEFKQQLVDTKDLMHAMQDTIASRRR